MFSYAGGSPEIRTMGVQQDATINNEWDRSIARTEVLDEPYHTVAPVATRVLKFWADTIIAMKPTESPQTIKAVLEETRQNPQETHCYLLIDETGIHDSPFSP